MQVRRLGFDKATLFPKRENKIKIDKVGPSLLADVLWGSFEMDARRTTPKGRLRGAKI